LFKDSTFLGAAEDHFLQMSSMERTLQTLMEVLIPQSLSPLGELDRKKYSEERENTKSLFKSHKNA